MKLFAALLLLAAAAPSPEIRYFKYQRPVQLPQGASGQTCVVIDPQTFSHASRDLADLRLFRDGVESPFVIRQAAAYSAQESHLTPLNLGQRDGQTVFDAPMPDSIYSDVQLDISGQDFIATVTVYGGHDPSGPPTRIGAYTIFDLSSQKLGRSTILHLPKSNFRYLHFEIPGPLSPNRIGGVSVASQPVSEPRYLTVFDAVHFQQKGRDSVAEFTTPARVPVDRIAFAPAAEPVNFNREVTVGLAADSTRGPAASTPPAPPVNSTGSLLRIHRIEEGHRIDDEQLSIDAPRASFDESGEWTITVHNGDDAPINFSAVRLEMLQRELCFEASPASSYTLFYGDDALRVPRYDYAAWSSPQPAAPTAVLAPGQLNASWQPRPDQRPFTEKHPALLWLALVLVVLLLGVIALRSAKRVNPPAPMP
ncbi:MAG TPA: DUF3999 family protein [Terracidiphilus sp.]